MHCSAYALFGAGGLVVRFNEQLPLTGLDSTRAVELLTACGQEEALKTASA
ncbi:MAG: hypothetical protein ABSE67_17070 [Xanthobacteraceae bacterium]|jgi:hypothetical protein